MRKQERQFASSYYDVQGIGSFGGIRPLAKTSKVKTGLAKAWLTSQDVYTLHKPVRYKFPRRKTIVGGPNQQWQADLIDVSRLSRHNGGIKFLLTCIDVFSKKAWVVPLKDKMATSFVDAFESIQHSLPKKLQTDKGTEFLNRKFQQWLKAHKVHHFTTENEDIKASIVERFNRTLKSKLWRYFTRHDRLSYMTVLDSMVDVYNRTPHRSIGMAPNDVTSRNKASVWFRLYAAPYPIKNLPSVLETQCGSARQDGRSRRDICLSGQKRSSLSWKERVHNLPHSCWRITLGKCWRALFIHRNWKKWQRRTTCIEWTKYSREQRIESWSNGGVIQTNSTVGWMWKISCDLSCNHPVAFLEWCPINGLSDEWGGNFVLRGWLLACEQWYKCHHEDFILSVMEDGNGGGRTWCCSRSRVPKAEIVYLCQVLLILSIVLASIYNLTNHQGDQQLWVALLSSCMGYLLPNPSIKSWVISISRYRVIPPWITTRETVWRILPPNYLMPSIWLGTGR